MKLAFPKSKSCLNLRLASPKSSLFHGHQFLAFPSRKVLEEYLGFAGKGLVSEKS